MRIPSTVLWQPTDDSGRIRLKFVVISSARRLTIVVALNAVLVDIFFHFLTEDCRRKPAPRRKVAGLCPTCSEEEGKAALPELRRPLVDHRNSAIGAWSPLTTFPSFSHRLTVSCLERCSSLSAPFHPRLPSSSLATLRTTNHHIGSSFATLWATRFFSDTRPRPSHLSLDAVVDE